MRLSIRGGTVFTGLFSAALVISSWCHAGASKSCDARMACPMTAACTACSRAAGPAQTSPRASLRAPMTPAVIMAAPAAETPPAGFARALPLAPRIAVGRPIYLVVRSLRL